MYNFFSQTCEIKPEDSESCQTSLTKEQLRVGATFGMDLFSVIVKSKKRMVYERNA